MDYRKVKSGDGVQLVGTRVRLKVNKTKDAVIMEKPFKSKDQEDWKDYKKINFEDFIGVEIKMMEMFVHTTSISRASCFGNNKVGQSRS